MSNTSEEESQSTHHHPPTLGGFTTVSSQGDTTAPSTTKKKRSLPGNPDPDAEVVALSPRTLLATNRYICEVCHKGFQRDQNLQLHRRGHNLPWKLKQRSSTEVKKKVYVCPEVTCIHHHPSRALGDLTGIKKHYSRKHGEKKWKCDKCSKRYAVQSDWKAHVKICGTKEYRCDCGTIFSRKDSFVTHRAFCDALAEENYKANHGLATMVGSLHSQTQDLLPPSISSLNSPTMDTLMNSSSSEQNAHSPLNPLSMNPLIPSNSSMLFTPSTSRASSLQFSGSSNLHMSMGSSYMSATALLQKAAEMGAKVSNDSISPILLRGFTGYSAASRTSGSMHEALDGHTDTSRCLEANDGLYVGNQSAFNMYSKWSNSDNRSNAYTQGGLMNPPVQLNAENQNTMVGLERPMERNRNGDLGEIGDGRMTQDFLGLGPVGEVSHDDASYVGNVTAISYSDGQQQNHPEVYAYQQGPTALEKPMWDS